MQKMQKTSKAEGKQAGGPGSVALQVQTSSGGVKRYGLPFCYFNFWLDKLFKRSMLCLSKE